MTSAELFIRLKISLFYPFLKVVPLAFLGIFTINGTSVSSELPVTAALWVI